MANKFNQGGLPLAMLASACLAACGGGGGGGSVSYNQVPGFIAGLVSKMAYDGLSDDLLTAGLGRSGLQAATPPVVADAANPTAAELRRLAIYNNYRALVDMTTNGGYGVLYGPNVDLNGLASSGEGRVGGTEYLAYADDGSGRQNVTLMVQVPASFDKANPCIQAVVASGSRGIYGPVAVGEWGLKRGCAVAYADKGTGNGAHDLQNDRVTLINGVVAEASVAGKGAQFNAGLSAAERTAFNAATPNRYAFKHAHSQQNPEKDWGRHTLQAVELAFYVLNDQFANANPATGQKYIDFKPENTLVIAAGVSNGGSAVLQAVEADTSGLVDGLVAGEPTIQPVANAALQVKRGGNTVATTARGLYDYFTLANLYQPCAALSSSVSAAPFLFLVNTARATNRCAQLKARGLLTATTAAEQADEALQTLVAYGWEADTNLLHASHYLFATPAVTVTYANTYGRASVRENLCGISFGATDATGLPIALGATAFPRIFGTGNGIPPTSGINLINNNAVGGPLKDDLSTSPGSGVADYNLDGAVCLRNLYTGSDALAARLATGIGEVKRTGNLRGRPGIIVHGRSDTLVPVNHTSRPYFGANKMLEGAASKLSYVEVTNANHFDSFLSLAGYDTRLVPLHGYVFQALNMMYAHLKSGVGLPPSQVVRTTPRGGTPGAAPAITAANVPPIAAVPASGNQISFGANTVNVPD
ncbi:hydroxybutyrate-dimer hydrolase [Burkholderiales bacterium]|nr:MAG: D-(-)-3-hydroxybutyrate oligomer hydrolase [Burkholderiales bacterium]CAG0964979.1 hydroxybutyrate-dimer hydrolase [Burkholderiales bacterium]